MPKQSKDDAQAGTKSKRPANGTQKTADGRKASAKAKSQPELTPERQAQLDEEWAVIEKHRNRPSLEKPARFKCTGEKDGKQHLEYTGDAALGLAKLLRDFGVQDVLLVEHLVKQLGPTDITLPPEEIASSINASIAAVQAIGPRDGTEAMLAVQMVACHNLALEHLKRLGRQHPALEVYDSIANRATKLMRTFTAQIETLHRYRNAGKQVITVNHIGQVNAETAAIAVGCTPGEHGGFPSNQGRPHVVEPKLLESLAASPIPALPGDQQANSAAMSGTGNGEWNLLSSRRQDPHRKDRKSA